MADIKQAGEIESFSVQPFVEAALMLARADEPERALSVLSSLPAFYRDHVPREIKLLREEILYSLVTPHAYMSVDMDATVDMDHASIVLEKTPRGVIAEKLIASLNEAGSKPHIVEMGPGEYWLPMGLTNKGYQFTYHDISLLRRTGLQAVAHFNDHLFSGPPKESEPYVFVAYELIEHLANPTELAIEALRHSWGRMPDHVLLSTPLYCYDGSATKDWDKKNGQPHLRSYTPQEFLLEANKVFPLYNWEITMEQIMVLKGTQRV